MKGAGTSFQCPALSENTLEMFVISTLVFAKFYFASTEDYKKISINVTSTIK